MIFNRLGFMSKPMVSRVMTTITKPAASLDVHVWHVGRVSDDQKQFTRMPQKQVLSAPHPDQFVKIPHAACELNIDFQHPDISKSLIDVVRSMLVTSAEYMLSKEGDPLSIKTRENLLVQYQAMPIRSMQVYLSWYPGNLIPGEKVLGVVPIQQVTELERKLFSTQKGSETWSQFLFGKHTPNMGSRDSDFNTNHLLNLQTITLYEVDYEAIFLDLSKFILFNCRDGVISTVNPTDESRYYMLDILRDHVAIDKITDPQPEHVCSTLVARVLRKGLGKENYASAVEIGKKTLGHGYAYPELIFEVAKVAETNEKMKNELPSTMTHN